MLPGSESWHPDCTYPAGIHRRLGVDGWRPDPRQANHRIQEARFMKRKPTYTILLVLTLALAPASAEAQVAWDAPMLTPPGAPAGWGLFLTDPAPGSGIGALGTWRGADRLGLRAGVAEGRRGDAAVYGGLDVTGGIVRHSPDFPLDVDWQVGAGVSIGERGLVSFPLGLTLGRALDADGVTFVPYVAPRLVVDGWFGGDQGPSGMELELAFDLGLDLAFRPGWAVAFGATFGDRSAVAIGLRF